MPSAPTNEFIPLCVPEVRGNEWTYVKECLDTGWVSYAGSFVNRFENEFAAKVGTAFAVATASGTAALHIALILADVRPGDEVITSAITFVAPVNAIKYVGAHPVLIDAEPDYWQMDPTSVHRFLEEDCVREGGEVRNRRTGRRVRAIMPVHVLGHPVDLDPILSLAEAYGLEVIEDATESLGATYRGRNVGTFGRLAAFSFNGNKLLTTGGGGMICTNDPALAARGKHLTTQAKAEEVEFVHDEIGFNYRLTNLAAAIGLAQLEQLDSYVAAKLSIARRYAEGLSSLSGIEPMSEAAWARSVFWMYTIRVTGTLDSRELLRFLGVERIQSRPLWQPMHRSPAHPDLATFDCPVADALNAECLSVPCSVGLTPGQQNRVIDAIRRYHSAQTP